MLLPCFSEEEPEDQRGELTCLTQPIRCGLVSNFTYGSLFLQPRAFLLVGLAVGQILATLSGGPHDHPGACQKCRFTGPTSEIPKGFLRSWKFEALGG